MYNYWIMIVSFSITALSDCDCKMIVSISVFHLYSETISKTRLLMWKPLKGILKLNSGCLLRLLRFNTHKTSTWPFC